MVRPLFQSPILQFCIIFYSEIETTNIKTILPSPKDGFIIMVLLYTIAVRFSNKLETEKWKMAKYLSCLKIIFKIAMKIIYTHYSKAQHQSYERHDRHGEHLR